MNFAKELGISTEEALALKQGLYELSQAEAVALRGEGVAYVSVQDRWVGFVVGAAVGAAFPALFGLGGVAGGAWTSAVLGASVGYRLGALFEPKPTPPRPERFAPVYGIDRGGELVTQGNPIPMVFANRSDVNPSGGVRWSGNLINSWIETHQGVVKLHAMYCLGVGYMGGIDGTSLYLDDQPVHNFNSNDIAYTFYTGSYQETPNTNWAFFSQVRSPQTQSALGVDKRGEVEHNSDQIVSGAAIFTTSVGAYTSNAGSTIIKNAATNVYDSGGTLGPIIYSGGSYLEFQVLETTTAKAMGFSNLTSYPFSSAPNTAYLNFGIELTETRAINIIEGGSIVYTSTDLYYPNDIFRIEVATNDIVTYKIRNGTGGYDTIYTSANTPSYDLYVHALLKTNGAQIYGVNLSRTQGISYGGAVLGVTDGSGTTSTFTVADNNDTQIDDFNRYTMSELYGIRSDDGGFWAEFAATFAGIIGGSQGAIQEFKVIAKDYDNEQLTVSPGIVNRTGQRIFCLYRAMFETSKLVNRVDFNLSSVLYSRPKPSQDQVNSKGGGGKK
jgi:hypothetical protein